MRSLNQLDFMATTLDIPTAFKNGTEAAFNPNTATRLLPWSPEGMRPRRDWIFGEVRRSFRRFVDDEGRWLHPPAFNPDPDPRVYVQVALAYLFGSEKDQELARHLLLAPPVRQQMIDSVPCAFVPEYVLALLKIAGDLVPRDLRDVLIERVRCNLHHYASFDLRHRGYNDNHVTLATATLVLGGEATGNEEAVEEGRANLLNLRDTLLRRGFIHEANDCYLPHTIYPLAAVGEWSEDEEIRQLARDCEARVWVDWIGHWHVNLARKPGPSARDYTQGRLNHLSPNTALWSIFGDAFGQPVYPPGDRFLDAIPAEHFFSFNGEPMDHSWDMGFLSWMSAHTYHIPEHVAELIYKRAYPHVISGTHEVGHCSEYIPRVGSKTGEVAKDILPYSAREIYTYQYQEADWAMGTASQRMVGGCPNNNWGVYYRKAAPLVRTADQGMVFCSFTINEKDCTGNHSFSMDPQDPQALLHGSVELWFDNGKYAAIQHERTSIMLYRPRMLDRHQVSALSTSILFPLCFENSIGRLELGDREITDFNGQSDQLCDLFVQDGPLYIGIRPLIAVDLPADIRVRVRRSGPWGVVDFYSYRGPALNLEEIDLCRMGGGFLCEVATREDFATLEEFKTWFRAGKIVQEQRFFMRQVRYHREGLDLGLCWDVWTDNIMFRTLNGRDYPMPKFQCSGIDPHRLPWMTGDVSCLDHFSWLQRQCSRTRDNWPDRPLTLHPAKFSPPQAS